ncbi:hypothetical protein N7501_008947 [Penicillium viridicatum]|nr:hypothetical protein N7501_008947 [Penicillium viridicatum]
MISTHLLEILRKPQLALNILNAGSVARKTVTAGRKRVVLGHLTGEDEAFWEVVGVGQSSSVGAGLVSDHYEAV